MSWVRVKSVLLLRGILCAVGPKEAEVIIIRWGRGDNHCCTTLECIIETALEMMLLLWEGHEKHGNTNHSSAPVPAYIFLQKVTYLSHILES